jgi:hypothetical protein
MKLLWMDLEAFRGAPDGRYEFGSGGVAYDTVLITGPSASGVTSVLEAIVAAKEAVGAYGPRRSASSLLRSGARRGSVATGWVLSPEEHACTELPEPVVMVRWEFGDGARVEPVSASIAPLFARYSRDRACTKFEYFPANRRLPTEGWSPAPPPPDSPGDMRNRLTRDPDKYAWVRRMLAEAVTSDALAASAALDTRGVVLKASQPDSLAAFKRAIESLLPDLRLRAVDATPKVPVVTFERRDRNVVELVDLSDFEQQGVLFAAAFTHLGLDSSVILIDLPELFVHPATHRQFFDAVRSLGPSNQLIAATRSPALLNCCDPGRLIDLGNRARRLSTVAR